MEKYMKKKLFSVFAVVIVAALCVATLIACNPYKANSIGSGDSDATVESNGGYVVKQGNYVYYINGYVGESADNNWNDSADATVSQGIVRAKLVNGVVDPTTATLVVRKAVYSSSTDGGIAIFGDWIYYTSANTDKDQSGTASTTRMDFMRTKTDGSVTQLIATLSNRSSQYLFTPNRILYYSSANEQIGYIDFTGMSQTASTNDGKGATSGVLIRDVESVVWGYDTDKIYYVKCAPSEDSYKNYNNLYVADFDGKEDPVTTYTMFVTEGKNPEDDQRNVFTYNLVDVFTEADGSNTLYYTKSYTYNSSTTTAGLFVARANDFKNTEKLLNTTASTTLVPLGYEDGALAYNASNVYCWYNGSDPLTANQVTGESCTIWKVDAQKGIVYYTASSSAKNISKISYKGATDNATVIMAEGIKTDWYALDFVGDDFYFFASDDSNKIHVVNLATFDKNEEDAKSLYIGYPLAEEEDEDSED